MEVKVLWRVEASQVKGSIVRGSDPEGRSKIVFVDNRFRGRLPRDGEETRAEVVRDSKPEDPRRGALNVRPIYEVAVNALTREVAEAEMAKIVQSQAISFAQDVYVKVALPGWEGELNGKLEQRENGPLSRWWRYTDATTGRWFSIHNPNPLGSYPTFPITLVVVRHQHRVCVIDWEQALTEFGEPESVESSFGGKGRVTWVDANGDKLYAEFGPDITRQGAPRYESISSDDYGISASRVRLGGKSREDNVQVARHERIEYGTYFVQRACITEGRQLTGEARRQVVDLLRDRLHSLEWHKQTMFADAISLENRSASSCGGLIHELREYLSNRFTALHMFNRPFEQLRHARAEVDRYSLLEMSFKDAGDPSIYEGIPAPDDALEVDRLIVENRRAVEALDTEITAIESEIAFLPAKHADPEFGIAAWEEIERSFQVVNDAAKSVEGHHNHESAVYRAARVKRDGDSLIEAFQKSTGNVEDRLDDLRRFRVGVENVLYDCGQWAKQLAEPDVQE